MTVIVTVRNEAASIDALLTALHAQTVQPAAVLITDAASEDTTRQRIAQWHTDHRHEQPFPLRCWVVKGNRSTGRNAAIAAAQTELIAITDAGCSPHPDWLAVLWDTFCRAAKRQGSRELVVAGYYDASPHTRLETAIVPYFLVMPKKVDPATFLPATRSILLPKIVWQQLGGFSPELDESEDFAFAHAIRAHHIPIHFAADAKVTWQPMTSLEAFARTVRRFARSDARAQLVRPKVLVIFVRYFMLTSVLWWLIEKGRWAEAVSVFGVLFVLYSAWAIWKNWASARKGWFWLPCLQGVSDVAVMVGTIQGLFWKGRS